MPILAIEKDFNKDLNTTIHLKNRGPSIKVPSIPRFVIMGCNFGYVYITNYRLKAYVYIGNSSCDNLTNSFFPEMRVSGCLTLNSWMKSTSYWHS